MSTQIDGKTFDEERALYGLRDMEVVNCRFEGPADGESALKESRNLSVKGCCFQLRYPLWHTVGTFVSGCELMETARAPFWYTDDLHISETRIFSPKALRESNGPFLENVTAVSAEFGWKCREFSLNGCDITSEYFLLDSAGGNINRLRLHGKYSLQYVSEVTISDSVLDTKDCLWHSRNVTVTDSVINGEYLGWYSENLTLIRCTVRGTQPLCYCRGLRMTDCRMEDADLAFEYSEVEADLKGGLISVKNPLSGSITADSIGEIIHSGCVKDCSCRVSVRE